MRPPRLSQLNSFFLPQVLEHVAFSDHCMLSLYLMMPINNTISHWTFPFVIMVMVVLNGIALPSDGPRRVFE